MNQGDTGSSSNATKTRNLGNNEQPQHGADEKQDDGGEEVDGGGDQGVTPRSLYRESCRGRVSCGGYWATMGRVDPAYTSLLGWKEPSEVRVDFTILVLPPSKRCQSFVYI
jgi:hypothetical protein